MANPYEAIIAENKRNKETHTLVWEKGNTPCERSVIEWFIRFFGGGAKQWKILWRGKWSRKSDGTVFESPVPSNY